MTTTTTRPWLTADYHAYLRSDRWYLMRLAAFHRARWRCEQCARGGQLNAHHLTYDRFGVEDLDDLIVLCRPCHDDEHRRIDHNRLDSARFAGWARWRHGPDWDLRWSAHDLADQYDAFLDEVDDR